MKESIESILNQTYQDLELLLVCDGSPPKTLDVVNTYASHPKVRIFKYKDNSGTAVRGRNRGVREARGEFIAFQDSDDIAEPNRLEISYQYIKESNADIIYGAWRIKKEKGCAAYESVASLSDGQIVYSPESDYQSLQQGNSICQSTVLAKVEALKKAGELKPEMQYCEDYELWLRVAYLGYRFKAIPKVLTTLRIHSGNLEREFKKEEKIWVQRALANHKNIPAIKPSLAFIIPGQNIAGGVMVICQHANRLIKKGYDVVLIDENPDAPFQMDWFPNLLPEIISADKIDRNIDIAVATHWLTAYTLKDFSVKRKLYFIQSDETRFSPPGSVEVELARQTYTFDFEFIVIAHWLQQWLKKEFGKSAYYVPNGIDTSVFYHDESLAPKNDKLRVLLEGAIDFPFKGMKEAFQVVDGIDCEVWCVSSQGRPESSWKCDRFFEKVPLQKMRQIYSSCDVLLKMSKIEGLFMPPLEMMACGGTVITNKVTGYDEYIVDDYNGLVVEQGDIKAAKEKLNQLINDRTLLQKLIQGGQETVKNWSWEESNNRLEKIIELSINNQKNNNSGC